MDFDTASQLTEDQAREHLESLRWPNGPVCAHCSSTNAVKLNGKATRPGVHKCRDCRKQFTVTVGTIFERSHIPLRKWILGFHIVCASKKGVSALQLQRMLGFKSYKTAWFMAHRIRFAMQNEPLKTKLGADGGIVEVDETWVGPRRPTPSGPNTWQDNKTPVMALVERGGNLRTRVLPKVNVENLRSALSDMVDSRASLHTDGYRSYIRLAERFQAHESVQHTRGQYSRKLADGTPVHVNTCEGFFALLKRGIHGAFHHVGQKHLHRYCDEFSFRWNRRKMTDARRTEQALKLAPGARLLYREPA